jgi:hypothetical protein
MALPFFFQSKGNGNNANTNQPTKWKQKVKFNGLANDFEDLAITNTLDFNRDKPVVLKIIPGQQNISMTLNDFTQAELSNLTANTNYVNVDGKVSLKTVYAKEMVLQPSLGSGQFFVLEFDEFKKWQGVIS